MTLTNTALLGRLGRLLSVVILSLSVGEMVACAKGNSTSDLNEEEVRDLQKIAFEVFDAIVAKDVHTILKYVDRKAGISWGPDGSKTYKEVEEDLISGQGKLFCILFGCPGSERKPIRAYFLEVQRSAVRIEARYLATSSRDITFAEVIYTWPNKPPLDRFDFPNPEFRREPSGSWAFESIFTP